MIGSRTFAGSPQKNKKCHATVPFTLLKGIDLFLSSSQQRQQNYGSESRRFRSILDWGLDISDVSAIMKRIAMENGTLDLTIDVDWNNVCFTVGKSVQALACFLMKWATAGFHVIPICDGSQRPVAQQATNKRSVDRKRNRIKSLSGTSCASFVVNCTVVMITVI